MTSVITDDYRKQNSLLHQQNAAYGVSGHKRVPQVLQFCAELRTQSVLDYGCGKSTLAKALPFPIAEYDPAIPGKDTVPEPQDFVICSDVLEHVEPDCVDAVLADLHRVTKRLAYLVPHTGASIKTLPDGRNTHLTQKPAEWWADNITQYFDIVNHWMWHQEAHFIVTPKKAIVMRHVFKTPLNKEERIARMRENSLRFKDVERLRKQPDKLGLLSVCGFSPSLADTYTDIRGAVMSTSGAHDFLISKGIIPRYHVELDSREHKVEFIKNSRPDIIYLISSNCHPTMFETLLQKKRNVIMWHSFTDDDSKNQIAALEELEPGARLVAGGTNVGMKSIVVGRDLGRKRFELHGMDCSYRGEQQWAGKHYTEPHAMVKIEVEGRVFDTSALMMQSTDDFFNQMNMLRGCSFKIYGDGLLEARMNLFLRDKKKALSLDWWKPVNFTLREAA